MKYSLLFILILFQSCITPLPPHRMKGRLFITPERIQFIQPHSTSREEVLLKLGDPDGVALTEKVFFYKWVVEKGMVDLPKVPYSFDISEDHFFLVSFNDDSTVRKTEIIKDDIKKRRKPLLTFIKEWYENVAFRN